jgi:hybrid cluster-associated redox disulfide protein|tara:strand:+ start:9983 stop:10348 length:366 start_codon:yes stop_codon:yes gene_type:complete
MADKITKDMKIADIVEKCPDSAQIMMEQGMHCIGCHVSAVETLEQGAKSHGMSDEDIGTMVEKINAIKKTETPEDSESKENSEPKKEEETKEADFEEEETEIIEKEKETKKGFFKRIFDKL